MWGRSLATSAAEAAFTNGICAHALDFDDSHPNARGHASASLIASAIAAGEVVGASGREVLAAYAIGLEVAGKDRPHLRSRTSATRVASNCLGRAVGFDDGRCAAVGARSGPASSAPGVLPARSSAASSAISEP